MPQDSTLPRAAGTPDISDARPRRSKLPLVAIVVAVVLIAFAANLAFKKSSPATSPLEPSPATSSVLVPAEREPTKLPVAVVKPAASAANALASAAVAAANSASMAITVAVDTFATLRSSIDLLTGRVSATEARERARDEQVASLRMDVDALKTAPLAARAASVAASAVANTDAEPVRAEGASPPRVVARRRAASTRQSIAANPTTASATARASASASAEGSVLAVDLWGGKPSVALARTGTGGTELRFFNEGESQGRVTLKRADVGSQKATFATPTGEFTLAPKEQ